ncbi:GNAT family N-acetyltransferase [Erysipelothrix tonsillarum]|uniref:GNAT family N-acetyltransferase n=1 Tax=Erysipelothrix tonsillarum TaxID=38402 RepID=UPI000375FBEF|nr:GNAT family N-acetyltransferase [Erysipelothrix tonsillarum]
MNNYIFESKRLGFRDLVKDDIKDIYEMNRDPDVMKYFPAPLTEAESKEYALNAIKHRQEFDYSKYIVELKDSGEFIGIIGLVKINFGTKLLGEVEIGWRMLKKYWHNGYAVEGAEATLKYGHKTLNIPVIYSFTAAINTPSENVMKRIGMNYIGVFDHPKVADDSKLKSHVLYKSVKTRK